LDGHETRDLTDWGHTREPVIEITKDGPYRITGGIPVTGADGQPVPRNTGASPEHCALCRCGQSKNKPFCSGAHWYADFRDPQLPADPTLFEWSGGLPALTRMTRLLYEKLVPADPELAAVFADIPPGYPAQEAGRIAESFGGPPSPGPVGRPELAEDQRARWVTLATRAATEAGLPSDAAFRAAFAAYLEWASRPPSAQPPTAHPAVRWDWTAAGPPDTTASDTTASDTTASDTTGAAPATDTSQEATVTLPGPDEPVSFEAHIKPLFRDKDRQSMSRAFDLWSVDDVRAHSAAILQRVANGSMPCDGAWPQDWVATFRRWTESGQAD
jgi:CDGSH-type Zn-finger protein/truncated hemoglobin YjbI